MGKYINKNDKYILNAVLKDFISAASEKLPKKYNSIKKVNDKTVFFDNMGIGDLAKPIGKRNASVKKQSFTNPYNSNSNMSNTNMNQMNYKNSSSGNNANQYGTGNPFYNKPINSSPYGSSSQNSYGQQQAKQYQSTPYGGNTFSQGNYGQNNYSSNQPIPKTQLIQQPKQVQKPAQQQLSNVQNLNSTASTQSFSDFMNLKLPTKMIFGTNQKPKIGQSNTTNASTNVTNAGNNNNVQSNPVTRSKFGEIDSNSINNYYSPVKNPDFKPKFTTKFVFLDGTGKPIPVDKLTSWQKNKMNTLRPASEKSRPIQYFNYENKALDEEQLPQNLKDEIDRAISSVSDLQRKEWDKKNTKLEAERTNNIKALSDTVQQSLLTGRLDPELAMQLKLLRDNFSNFQTNLNSSR